MNQKNKMIDTLFELDIEYARFNAKRTLDTTTPSNFKVFRFDQTIVTSDSERIGNNYFNRILNPDESSIAQFDEMITLFDALETKPRIDVLREKVSPALDIFLQSRGYTPTTDLSYFSRNTALMEEEKFLIERWQTDKADMFFDLLELAEGPISRPIRQKQKHFYCSEDFRQFVVIGQEGAMGWATSYIYGELALLGNAFVFPQYRRRGCHRELLLRRLDDAYRLGVKKVFTDVEENSASYFSCLKADFDCIATFTLWHHESPILY